MSQHTFHDSIVDTFLKKEVSDIRYYADHVIVVLNSGEELWVEPFTAEDREVIWDLYTSAEHGHLFNSLIKEEKKAQLTGL